MGKLRFPNRERVFI